MKLFLQIIACACIAFAVWYAYPQGFQNTSDNNAANGMMGGMGVLTRTNLTMNTVVTNTSTRLWVYKGDTWVTPAAVVGIARVVIYVDDTGSGAFQPRELYSQATVLGLLLGAQTNNFMFALPAGARAYPTNLSSGLGNAAGIVPNTIERIQL